jgi:hypothetical protein
MKLKIFAGLILLFSSQAFAWGGLGHRTVARIAERNLLPHTAAQVGKLLGDQTLDRVASWADDVRSQGTYRATVWYHFEKMSDGVSFLDSLRALPDWQQKKGGIVGAILMANEILRSNKATPAEKTDALKFLVHFVGDIHQPLHTGRPADNGGSKITVTWFGETTSLHHVWDTAMILTGHPDIVSLNELFEDSSDPYAEYLVERLGGTSATRCVS